MRSILDMRVSTAVNCSAAGQNTGSGCGFRTSGLLSLHPNIIVHVENVVSLFSSPSTSSQKVRKCGGHKFLSQAIIVWAVVVGIYTSGVIFVPVGVVCLPVGVVYLPVGVAVLLGPEREGKVYCRTSSMNGRWSITRHCTHTREREG